MHHLAPHILVKRRVDHNSLLPPPRLPKLTTCPQHHTVRARLALHHIAPDAPSVTIQARFSGAGFGG